jgi:hypothetical protein
MGIGSMATQSKRQKTRGGKSSRSARTSPKTEQRKPALPSPSKGKAPKPKADSQALEFLHPVEDRRRKQEKMLEMLAEAPAPDWKPKPFALPWKDGGDPKGMKDELKSDYDSWQWLKEFTEIRTDAELVDLINSVNIDKRSPKNRFPLRSVTEIASLTQMMADHPTYQDVHGPILIDGGDKIADGIHREIGATLIGHKKDPNYKCKRRIVEDAKELEALLAERENRRASSKSIIAMNFAIGHVDAGKGKGRGKDKDGSFNEACRRLGFSRQTGSDAIKVVKQARFLCGHVYNGVLTIPQAAAIADKKLHEATVMHEEGYKPPTAAAIKKLAREALKAPAPEPTQEPKGEGDDGADTGETKPTGRELSLSNFPKPARAATQALRTVENWVAQCEAMSMRQVEGMVRDWLNGVHDFASCFPKWAELDLKEAWQQLTHLIEQRQQ